MHKVAAFDFQREEWLPVGEFETIDQAVAAGVEEARLRGLMDARLGRGVHVVGPGEGGDVVDDVYVVVYQ